MAVTQNNYYGYLIPKSGATTNTRRFQQAQNAISSTKNFLNETSPSPLIALSV
jgi:hypothetical protein